VLRVAHNYHKLPEPRLAYAPKMGIHASPIEKKRKVYIREWHIELLAYRGLAVVADSDLC